MGKEIICFGGFEEEICVPLCVFISAHYVVKF
jgi:hypothetical protein